MVRAQGTTSAMLLMRIQYRVQKWYHDKGHACARVINFGNLRELLSEVDEGDVTRLDIQFLDKLGHVVEGNSQLGDIQKEMPKQMPKKGGKGVFKRLFSALAGSSSGRSSSGASHDPSDIGHSGRWSGRFDSEQVGAGSSSIPEDPYEELAEECASQSGSFECQHMPFLSEHQLDALPLPFQLQQDIPTFDRNHMKQKANRSLQDEAASQMLIQVEALIEAAREQGDDLSIYKKKGRGIAEEESKVSKDGRIVLVWRNDIPVGPGKWSARFNGLIGCIARSSQLWDISYTFTENASWALTESWKKLLRSYYLEEDVERSYKYARHELGEVFKKYRNFLKTYTNKKVFQYHWQRFAGLPNNVEPEQYAYLLLYWETPEAKAASERGSANRAKNEYGYYGGSSRTTRYKHYVEETGEEVPPSATWSALHIRDNMPEESQTSAQKQFEALSSYETTWRGAHPDESMTYEDEITMAEQIFPSSKPKGKIPLIGPTSLTKSKSRKATSSSASTPQMSTGQTTSRQSGWDPPSAQTGWGTWPTDDLPREQPPPPSYPQPSAQTGWGIWPSYDPPRASQSGYHTVQFTDEEWAEYNRLRDASRRN